jgi:hypothetical protein
MNTVIKDWCLVDVNDVDHRLGKILGKAFLKVKRERAAHCAAL